MRYFPLIVADVLSATRVAAGEFVAFAIPRIDGQEHKRTFSHREDGDEHLRNLERKTAGRPELERP